MPLWHRALTGRSDHPYHVNTSLKYDPATSVFLYRKPLTEHPLVSDVLSPSGTGELTSEGDRELFYGQPGWKPLGSSLCSGTIVRVVSSQDGREPPAPTKEV